MEHLIGQDRLNAAKVVDLILQERKKSLSDREWKHRIAGYGYSVKDTAEGQMITTLPHDVEVCALPTEH